MSTSVFFNNTQNPFYKQIIAKLHEELKLMKTKKSIIQIL